VSDNFEALIEKYRGEDGKLTCSNAFKIATKLKISPKEVGDRAKQMSVRIGACDLGQFGKQPMGTFKDEVFSDLKKISDKLDRVYCKDARELAKKSNLKSVRTAIKEGGLDVIYCELGCFKEKKRTRLYVKTKTWIENQNRDLLFGKGKTEILELIKEFGSIAKAAEKLGMSYKKAWSHIQILQKNLDDVLVETRKGGGEQGGTVLTQKANEYIEKYRQLQNEIEEFANARFKELFLKDRGEKR
jgi:molybdate transport repressor ModE-like protein